jgi:branched-chain amino acid transport system permease protein
VSLTTLLQALLSGGLVGCLYALIAVGFSLVLSVSRALNLAHGEVVVLGGYAGYATWLLLGVHPLLLVPLAALATLPLGLVWDRLLARLPPGAELSSCVLTFGLALLLQNAMASFWSGEYRLIASPVLGGGLVLGGVALSHARLAAALLALAAVGSLALGLRRARWGRAIRATSLDREAAALLGIDVERATRLAFLLALGLAGGAGLLFATIHYLHPAAGGDLTLLAITLALWAGIGRMRVLLPAGIALGVTEALTVAVLGSGWRQPALASLLLASLLARGGALARGFGHR